MNLLRWSLLLAISASPVLSAEQTAPMAVPGMHVFQSADRDWSMEILDQSPAGLTVEFRLNRLEIQQDGDRHLLFVDGLNTLSTPSLPELPSWSGVFAVPPRAGLGLNVLESDSRVIAGVVPRAAEDWQSDYPGSGLPERRENAQVYGGGHFPARVSSYGEPALWHGVRVVPLDITPFDWNAANDELTVYTRLLVRLDFQGHDTRNTREIDRPLSRLARDIVRPDLQNPAQLDADVRLDPLEQSSLGRYLVVIIDAGIPYLQPWVDWKRQMGYEVTVVAQSELGGTPTFATIKQRVMQEYTDNGLDYLLLVGDYDLTPQLYNLPSNTVQSGQHAEGTWGGDIVSDHEYTLLEGTDYFPEILVGRLSVDSHQQLSTLVTKLVAYEKTPPISQTDNWYRDALMIYDVALAGSRRETKLAVRDLLFADGFAHIDTVHNDYYNNNLSPSIVTNFVNQGVSFVNYRGYGHRYQWVGPEFGVTQIMNDLNNFNAWPVVTSIVCGGGDFGSNQFDPCFGEAWLRAATGPNPRGAVAFIGPSELDTHTKWNNAIDLGIYHGLLHERIHKIGALMMRGKTELWTQFPNERIEDWSPAGAGNCVPHYFHSYNLLGDPAMEVRTMEPLALALDAPSALAAGPRQLHLRVTSSDTGQAVAGAHAYFYQAASLSGKLATTDANGDAWLDLGELETGDYLLTVHGVNLYPVQRTVTVSDMPSALALTGFTVQDEDGNGDGTLNPGEDIELVLDLYEAGTDGLAQAGMLSLVSTDERLTVTQSEASIDPLAPGGEQQVGGFLLSLDPQALDGDTCPLDLYLDGEWVSRLNLSVSAAHFAVDAISISQGEFEPGAMVEFSLRLRLEGEYDSPEGSLRLHVISGGVDLQDELGSLPAISQNGQGTAGPFTMTLSEELLPGTQLAFELEFTALDSRPLDRRPWSVTIGTPGVQDPLGPDAAGYVIYDSGDTGHEQAPAFIWEDISSFGTPLNMHDEQDSWWNGGIDGDSRVVDLPFMFTYYDQIWATLTVNSNGWVAMGDQHEHVSGHNTTLPAAQGAPGMVAVFWNDLYNHTGSAPFGDVYTWYEQGTGEFIIQWHNMRPTESSSFQQFQLVLRDPQVWPTESGNAQMLMYYNQVTPATGENATTVGIQDYLHQVGLQYAFNNVLASTSAPLANGLALLVTQGPVLESTSVGAHDARPTDFQLLAMAPNPFNPSTMVSYSLGSEARLGWTLCNLLGQQVASGRTERVAAGEHSFRLDGASLASGVYFLRLEATMADGTKHYRTGKLALVR